MRNKIYTVFLSIILVSINTAGFTVRGKITTTTDTAVQYALIRFVCTDDTSKVFSTITNTLGEYAIIFTGVSEPEPINQNFTLHQNYPNPFSERTEIPYSIKENSSVAVTIYDILGRKVKSFDRSYQPSGTYSVEWNGTDEYGKKVSYGIYFYRITSKQGVQTKKMVYVKPSDVGPFLSHHKFVNKTLINDENTFDKTYTVYIDNTNSTKPKIEPLKIENVVIQGDTVINYQVEEVPKWELLGLEGETITAIAIHPNNPQIIYAGSDYDFSAGWPGKLFKSIDGGTNWDTIRVGGSYRSIVIDPTNPEIVYAVSGSIIKTTNGGDTWTSIINGIILGYGISASSIIIDPVRPNILYAGTGGYGSGTLYKSTNGGMFWFDLDTSSNGWLFDGVISLAIDPNNTNIIYAGTDWRGRLLKSTDAGNTWAVTGLGETNQMIDMVTLNPKNTSIVYAGVRFEGFFISSDGGISWDSLKSNLSNKNFSTAALLFDIQNNEIIYATHKRQAYRSTNGGLEWNKLSNDFENNTIQVKYLNPNGLYIYGGRLESGLKYYKLR